MMILSDLHNFFHGEFDDDDDTLESLPTIPFNRKLKRRTVC